MDENLGVAARAKVVAFGFQSPSQSGKIVNLAVEDRPDCSLFIRKGLMTTGKVDDGQSPESERGVLIEVGALIIRPTVHETAHHALKQTSDQRFLGISPDRAAYTTHDLGRSPCSIELGRGAVEFDLSLSW
jgi:hypothetical protein